MQKRQLADAAQAVGAYRSLSTVRRTGLENRRPSTCSASFIRKRRRPEQALHHFLAAGDTHELANVAILLPEKSLDLPPHQNLIELANWYRASVFRAAAATADLLPDGQARLWIETALAELDLNRPDLPRTASAVQAAFAVAALLSASTPVTGPPSPLRGRSCRRG
ncbi:hypothetical protein [Streptomyces sp. NPDC058653]|uniref:hypothetical protein n=1 Tax=Streptomyces sp. NPDC058653 TaxID=3346576 RepID=UPI0036692AFA